MDTLLTLIRQILEENERQPFFFSPIDKISVEECSVKPHRAFPHPRSAEPLSLASGERLPEITNKQVSSPVGSFAFRLHRRVWSGRQPDIAREDAQGRLHPVLRPGPACRLW